MTLEQTHLDYPNPPFYPDHQNLLVYLDADGQEQPVTTVEDWEKRRAHILANMQLVMGPLPDASKKVPLDVAVLSEEKLPLFTRQQITFRAEENDRVPAYLLIPHELKEKAPAVLCLHETAPLGKVEAAGLGGLPNMQHAAHLAERGYVTLAPDYPLAFVMPGYTEYSVDPYALGYVSGSMKAIWNHMRAVDLLQSLPQVNGERIGCIGHSLGAHSTLFVAAFDERIKVMVSSCGFTTFQKYLGGDLSGWCHGGYMPRIASVYDKDPKKVPFDFPEVIAALAPRAFFANAPLHDDNFDVSGAKDCMAAVAPVYKLFGAEEKLTAHYPDCRHDFPEDVLQAAYNWIDHWLNYN